jgi:inhibitor of Bruton tyrosine kinase
MSVLHTYFHRRDQQAFQRALEASTKAISSSNTTDSKPSSSLGRSLSTSPHLSLASASSAALDVNARDALGRTVLHLACASTHPSAPTYARLLLAHPHIQPNLHDAESHWTALHRALYHGSLACALLLLRRPDVDVYAKDSEGYTPFDVWNSSIEGTKPPLPPPPSSSSRKGKALEEPPWADTAEADAEMYVWGSNRNAGLGVGDADDRAFPELVQFDKEREGRRCKTIEEQFRTVRVKDVGMARFHTGNHFLQALLVGANVPLCSHCHDRPAL